MKNALKRNHISVDQNCLILHKTQAKFFISDYITDGLSIVRMNDFVSLQVMHQNKGFPALRTAVRSLPAVRPLVDPETALLREPLPADRAPVRLLPRVRAMVDPQMGRALEALPADCAPESPLPLVALLVELKLVQTTESLTALSADVAARRWNRLVLRIVAARVENRTSLGRNLPVHAFSFR